MKVLRTDGSEEGRLVYEGVACFAEERPEPVEPEPFALSEPEECVFTADRIYEEQWLFHGPAMQALVEIGPVSLEGIEGTIEVLPLADLLSDRVSRRDFTPTRSWSMTFTHLLGLRWGLDRFDQGDVIFPLGMGRFRSSAMFPSAGTCRSLAGSRFARLSGIGSSSTST